MSIRQTIPALLWAFCLPLSLLAQQNKLIVSPAEPLTVKRGGTASSMLKVATLPGFHVNSNKPKDEFLIPLTLTWTSGPLETISVVYPPPQDLKVGNDILSVLTGTFQIETQFKAGEKPPAGPSAMVGKLHYQACNNQMCFRPSTVEVRVPVVVE